MISQGIIVPHFDTLIDIAHVCVQAYNFLVQKILNIIHINFSEFYFRYFVHYRNSVGFQEH